jgi:hypothetical protein
MKRMNEVFELPIRYVDAVSFAVNLTKGETEAIAHAINNVDALADALGDLVNDIENNLNPRYSFEQAVAALNAYRGVK